MRFWAAFFSACLLISALTSGCNRKPDALYAEAEQRWKEGDYLGAVRDFRRIVEDFSRSDVADDAYFSIGTIETLYLADFEDALLNYRSLLRDYPDTPHRIEAQKAIAEIYDRKLDNPGSAITEYQKLIEVAANEEMVEETRYRIGEDYIRLNDPAQARVEWGLLLDEAPQSVWADDALYRTGTTFFLERDYAQAEATYRRLLEEYPRSDLRPDAKFGIANCLEETGRIEEALSLYREILPEYPNPDVIKVKIRFLED